jgi:hypothetical protein
MDWVPTGQRLVEGENVKGGSEDFIKKGVKNVMTWCVAIIVIMHATS